ncbi:YihY family inner membrane protein [Desertibaculum subflavum]|uniref:YihY family inner membrane protein n=1 Tax=Desertibaculum subflavum TaxID=2268458 RepID=UPI000E66E240
MSATAAPEFREGFARRYALDDGVRFARYTLARFFGDNGLQLAGSLTYTTLLAVVPTAVVGFATLAGVPAFEPFREQILEAVFTNLLPDAMVTVQTEFNRFASNAGKLGLAGLAGMMVTAILTLSAIEGAFNTIWRVRERRGLAARLAIYWAILTLGPLLFGASISLTSYVYTAARTAGIEGYAPGWLRPAAFAPVAVAWLGFAWLYFTLPNRAVRPLHALIGGGVAAILFEGLKRGFAWYVTAFPTYQAIYGALAAIPILLVWTYLAWSVTLFGALITASLPDWRHRARLGTGAGQGPAPRLAIALALLATLRQAARNGQQIRRRELMAVSEAPPDIEDDVLDKLQQTRFVARTGRDRWMLARDLAAVTLYDLLAALELVPFGGDVTAEQEWAVPYRDIVFRVDADQRDLMAVPLDRLLAGVLPTHDKVVAA